MRLWWGRMRAMMGREGKRHPAKKCPIFQAVAEDCIGCCDFCAHGVPPQTFSDRQKIRVSFEAPSGGSFPRRHGSGDSTHSTLVSRPALAAHTRSPVKRIVFGHQVHYCANVSCRRQTGKQSMQIVRAVFLGALFAREKSLDQVDGRAGHPEQRETGDGIQQEAHVHGPGAD